GPAGEGGAGGRIRRERHEGAAVERGRAAATAVDPDRVRGDGPASGAGPGDSQGDPLPREGGRDRGGRVQGYRTGSGAGATAAAPAGERGAGGRRRRERHPGAAIEGGGASGAAVDTRRSGVHGAGAGARSRDREGEGRA